MPGTLYSLFKDQTFQNKGNLFGEFYLPDFRNWRAAQNPSGNPHSPGNTSPNPTCWGGIERTSQNTAADLCPVVLWPGSSEVLQTPPAYFQPADCAALGPPVESQGRAS